MSYRADGYWWAYVLFVLLLIALGVLVPVWTLTAPGGLSEGNVLWMVGVDAIALVHILGFAVYGAAAFSRMRRRHRAIAGDSQAMPESTIKLDVADVFNVSRDPLVLPWQAERPAAAMLLPAFVGAELSFLLALMLSAVIPHIMGNGTVPTYTKSVNFAANLHYGAIALCVPVVWLLSLLLRGRLTIIEATDDGIRFQSLVGRVRLVRWQDMRLLEVGERERAGTHGKWVTRWYVVYDARSRMIPWIEWGTAADLVQPYVITWDEMWALSREMVDVIYQRTGLMPRTFSKSLQRGPEDSPEQTWWEDDEEMEIQDAHS